MIPKRSKKKMISLAAIAVLFFVSIALVESFALETNTDRPGMDYSNFDLASANPSLCEQACNSDPDCRAFTYVKPGFQGANARCWLKNGIPTATRVIAVTPALRVPQVSPVTAIFPIHSSQWLELKAIPASGGQYTRYLLAVVNRAAYPADLFQVASDLPPCGSNSNSARTWVDIYDQDDNRIYGFCALGFASRSWGTYGLR